MMLKRPSLEENNFQLAASFSTLGAAVLSALGTEVCASPRAQPARRKASAQCRVRKGMCCGTVFIYLDGQVNGPPENAKLAQLNTEGASVNNRGNLLLFHPGKLKMKSLLTICLLLVSTPSIASTQQRGQNVGSLTRAETKEAESRLSELGYWTGPIDGIFDPATRSALLAFQKCEGRQVTGRLTLEELEAIRSGAAPQAKDGGYEHVEVDLDRQVLLMVHKSGLRVLPVSTGNDQSFMDEGQSTIAYTPRGRFIVYDKETGWGSGPLGSVYYANYISGGVAIHGSRSVPNAPASHGCIRVPMFAARELSKLLPVGSIVLVYDKLSFVSGKAWADNPELKQAALASTAFADPGDYVPRPKRGTRSSTIKKARSKLIRAGSSK